MDIVLLASKMAKSGTASLHFKEGGSDKVYHVDIIKTINDLVDVQIRYGRRGASLNVSNKNPSPITRSEAEKMMIKVLREKLGKGYQPSANDDDYVPIATVEVAKSVYAPQLLNAIDADDLSTYINSPDWIMQEKKDGERRLLVIEPNSVKGINRKGMYVDIPVKLSKMILGSYDLTGTTVIDGEIIGDWYFPFDILKYDGNDITSRPYEDVRLDYLNKVCQITKLPYPTSATSSAVKKLMFDELAEKLAEGVVFKHYSAPYSAGRPNSGGPAMKYKFVETATVLAGEVRKVKRSVEMYVMNDNRKVFVGFVTVLPNFDIPKENDLIEVQYLYYYEDGSLYQPVFKGFRTDLTTADELSSLKRKGSN